MPNHAATDAARERSRGIDDRLPRMASEDDASDPSNWRHVNKVTALDGSRPGADDAVRILLRALEAQLGRLAVERGKLGGVPTREHGG